jgi:hypothetical protein
VFIDYGYDEALRKQPDFKVKNLTSAAEVILDAARASVV